MWWYSKLDHLISTRFPYTLMTLILSEYDLGLEIPSYYEKFDDLKISLVGVSIMIEPGCYSR